MARKKGEERTTTSVGQRMVERLKRFAEALETTDRIELKIVTLHPEYAEALAKEYPELMKYVKDDWTTFVVNPETRDFWPADQFLSMHALTAVLVNPVELISPSFS
jgi:Fe-S oxidoreductase